MADMLVEDRLLTLDELIALSASQRVEIINGELIDMGGAGILHAIVAGNLYAILRLYLDEHDIGVVLPDNATFLMYSPTARLKDSFVPDVAFLRHDNVPADWDAETPHPGTPNLAVEIVSPGNDAADIQYKRLTYLEKGTEQVWLVYPRLREVHVYTQSDVTIHKGDAAVDGSALFPGIAPLPLSAIFKLPVWAQPKG
jgi:Uma2 family endonuclease